MQAILCFKFELLVYLNKSIIIWDQYKNPDCFNRHIFHNLLWNGDSRSYFLNLTVIDEKINGFNFNIVMLSIFLSCYISL